MVKPQASRQKIEKIDAFLDDVDALLFFIEPDDFDFMALAVKLRALLEVVTKNDLIDISCLIEYCDKLQIKQLPAKGSASLMQMREIITDYQEGSEESDTVTKLVALYKQDAQDRVVAHINRITARLCKQNLTHLAVIITKADKLSPFKQTKERPTVLIPDHLRKYQSNNVQQLAHVLSQYWGKVDDRWDPIIMQLFEIYEHFFNDLSQIKGDYQVFFVTAMGDVDWDKEEHRMRPPKTIKPQGIEDSIEWCVHQISRHKINKLKIARHFLILFLLSVFILFPIHSYNKNLEHALRFDTWEELSSQWWAPDAVQHHYQLLQLQAYQVQFNNLKSMLDSELQDEIQIKSSLNQLTTDLQQLKITEKFSHIKKDLQTEIYERKQWLKVKTNYITFKNKFNPDYHYQLECCLHKNNQCHETIDFSNQVSLSKLQIILESLLQPLQNPVKYKKLVCLKKTLQNANLQIKQWHKTGLPLHFGEISPKLLVHLGTHPIQSGDKITWNSTEKLKVVNVNGEIKYQVTYQEPYEFVNNICWNSLQTLKMRPFFELYLKQLDALFPIIDEASCQSIIPDN